MKKRENIKYSNQIFTTLLNRIPDNPTESNQIEFYIVALPPSVSMSKQKQTLA